MKIVTYFSSPSDPAPLGQEYIARIRCEFPGHGKVKAGEDWHPVIFTADTLEGVRAMAQAWWDAELAKAAKQEANRIAAGQRMKARAPTKLPMGGGEMQAAPR